MTPHGRRATDALLAVDGVLETYLQNTELGGRRMANLAATIAIENSGAAEGSLLLDQGQGLEAVFAIREDLSPATGGGGPDANTLNRLLETAEPVADGDSLAVPILVERTVRGVLYLKSFRSPPGKLARNLANRAVGRIATLLQNAELVEALDRSQADLEVLARLTETLSSGRLTAPQLDVAVGDLARSTGDSSAAIVLFGPDGSLESSHLAGVRDETLARQLAEADSGTIDSLRRALPEPALVSVLQSEEKAATQPTPAGLVCAFRASPAYRPAESSFFQAFTHLLSGTLARHRYFRQAARDALTGTGSRMALQLQLADAEDRSRTTELPYSLLLVDVDHFKTVNDTLGHLVGDRVLRTVAKTLRGRLRALDTIARYGGDEFVILLPDTPLEAAAELANELTRLVRDLPIAVLPEGISLSIGVADSAGVRDTEELMRRADSALYRAKAEGRNRATAYDPEMDTGSDPEGPG